MNNGKISLNFYSDIFIVFRKAPSWGGAFLISDIRLLQNSVNFDFM